MEELFRVDRISSTTGLITSQFSRIYFNKGSYLLDLAFRKLALLNPRWVFVADDGWSGGILLFPFWVMGVGECLKKRRFGVGGSLVIFSLLSFEEGVLLMQMYLVYLGMRRVCGER
jgi:hypothetical protein